MTDHSGVPLVLRSRPHLEAQHGVKPAKLPINSLGATYTMAQVAAWIDAERYALSFGACAQSTGGPSAKEATPPGAGKAPEQAAIDACQGKKDGDRVTFTSAAGKKRRWTVDGVLAARSGVATAARKVNGDK